MIVELIGGPKDGLVADADGFEDVAYGEYPENLLIELKSGRTVRYIQDADDQNKYYFVGYELLGIYH